MLRLKHRRPLRHRQPRQRHPAGRAEQNGVRNGAPVGRSEGRSGVPAVRSGGRSAALVARSDEANGRARARPLSNSNTSIFQQRMAHRTQNTVGRFLYRIKNPGSLAMFAAIPVFPRTHGAAHRHDLRPIKLPNSTNMIRCRTGNVSFRGETSYLRQPNGCRPERAAPAWETKARPSVIAQAPAALLSLS
jgi:hypothetical protein